MRGAGRVEQPTYLAVADFGTDSAGRSVVMAVAVVLPAPLFDDGLRIWTAAPQPFSETCARSPSASSGLARARKYSLACWYCWVVICRYSYFSDRLGLKPVLAIALPRPWQCLNPSSEMSSVKRSEVVRGAVLGLVLVLHAGWAVGSAGVAEPAFVRARHLLGRRVVRKATDQDPETLDELGLAGPPHGIRTVWVG